MMGRYPVLNHFDVSFGLANFNYKMIGSQLSSQFYEKTDMLALNYIPGVPNATILAVLLEK